MTMGEGIVISHSVVVDAPVEVLYDMVADITRMGEWSSACTGATWDDGVGPEATEGAWFTGHNVMFDNPYDSRCEITAAERPTTIAWMAAGREEGRTEWRYRFTPVDGGTEVTESWTVVRAFPPDRVDDEMIERMRTGFALGIQDTLAKLKSSAEGS